MSNCNSLFILLVFYLPLSHGCAPHVESPKCDDGYRGTTCESRADYYKSRWLSCKADGSSDSYCESWIGCYGPLVIGEQGYDIIVGSEPDCWHETACSLDPCASDEWCEDLGGGNYACNPMPIGCDTNPCQNGGTCDYDADGYVCTCTIGYMGTNCETSFDDCSPNPCENGGTCSAGVDGFTCTCSIGWTGTTCSEVDACNPDPCEHGRCSDFGSGHYHCSCDIDWVGDTCNVCGTTCESRADYYKDRWLICKDYGNSDSYCESWMGCYGPLVINEQGYGVVVGSEPYCWHETACSPNLCPGDEWCEDLGGGNYACNSMPSG